MTHKPGHYFALYVPAGHEDLITSWPKPVIIYIEEENDQGDLQHWHVTFPRWEKDNPTIWEEIGSGFGFTEFINLTPVNGTVDI